MAGWSSMAVYLGAFLADELGFGPGLLGVAYSLSGVATLIGSIAAGRLRHVPFLQHLSWMIALPAVLLGLAFVLPVGAVGVLGLLTAAAFIAAVSYVGLMTLTISQAQASGRGTATAMVLTGAVLNLGVTTGGALGGILLATSGWPAVGVGLTLLALASATLLTQVPD